MLLSVTDSDDEDDIDGGDVAERGMNGVCARPIWSSDLLYRGTATSPLHSRPAPRTMCSLPPAHFALLLYVRGQRGDSWGYHFNKASSPDAPSSTSSTQHDFHFRNIID